MKFFQYTILTLILAYGVTAQDQIIRALPLKTPLALTHADSIELVVGEKLELYLKVEGRQCLALEDYEYCDFIEHSFELPEVINAKVIRNPKGEAEVHISILSEGSETYIGFQPNPFVYESVVDLIHGVSFFYDKVNAVPVLVYSEKEGLNRHQKKWRNLFNVLQRSLE
jgi:hypothetical protein